MDENFSLAATPDEGDIDIDMEDTNYKMLKHLGTGSFGVAKLMLHCPTNETVAVKFIKRGTMIDKNVEREIKNHRVLNHPNVIQFREVFLTSTHLGISMEYAAGGELFNMIATKGRFTEDVARYYFQQLVAGVEYCHSQDICHRDLKLENTLLDGKSTPGIKICDFGYSKSALFDSQPKSTVGSPAYLAPEVLQRKTYSGELADVWSIGVTLYVMLAGRYPFEDPSDPTFKKSIQRILHANYTIPRDCGLTKVCCDLISQIFMAEPSHRITVQGIRQHPWFLKNLPSEIWDIAQPAARERQQSLQSLHDVQSIIYAARIKPETPTAQWLK